MAQDSPKRAQDSLRNAQDILQMAPRRPKRAQDSPKTAQDNPRMAQDGSKMAQVAAVLGLSWAILAPSENLEKKGPRGRRFLDPKMDLKMVPKCVTVVTFGGSGVPKNEPEKLKKRLRGGGPILLPSVAPEGTPPAMLLKKLAFGISSLHRCHSTSQKWWL